jgi:hypothetical protein
MNGFTDKEMQAALEFLTRNAGMTAPNAGMPLPVATQPQRPNTSSVPDRSPSPLPQPVPESEGDLSVIAQMVTTIEGKLRPEGVESLWILLTQLIFRRQRINRFEVVKGIGFYTLSFCMPWLAIKATGFSKAVAGTAFMVSSKTIFPLVGLLMVGALMRVYRKPQHCLMLCEVTIGFILSCLVFSLI